MQKSDDHPVILLMAEILHHLECIKPCEPLGIYHISRLAGFLPSTVSKILALQKVGTFIHPNFMTI